MRQLRSTVSSGTGIGSGKMYFSDLGMSAKCFSSMPKFLASTLRGV